MVGNPALPAPFSELDYVEQDPAKIREEPEFRCRIYNSANAGQPSSILGVTDIIQQLVRPSQGDAAQGSDGTSDTLKSSDARILAFSDDPDISSLLSEDEALGAIGQVAVDVTAASQSMASGTWATQPDFLSIYRLRYVQLGSEATEGASEEQQAGGVISGFMLPDYRFKQNMVLKFPPDVNEATLPWRYPVGSSTYERMTWVVKRPTTAPTGSALSSSIGFFKGWEVVMPQGEDSTGVQFTRILPNAVATVETELPLERNQQFSFNLHWQGKAAGHNGLAGWRLAWGGGTYSILFREGSVPSIDRKLNGQWKLWRPLNGAPVTDFSNADVTKVQIRRIAGRMVVLLGEQTWTLVDAQRTAPAAGLDVEAGWELREVVWPKGKVTITTFGALFDIHDFALKKYRYPASPEDCHFVEKGRYYKYCYGFYRRRASALLPLVDEIAVQSSPAGWHNTDAWVRLVEPVEYGDIAAEVARQIDYTVVLRGSRDGIDTPFLTCHVMHFFNSAATTEGPEYLDVAPAMINASERVAEPGVTATSDWSFSLSPHLLDLLDHTSESSGSGEGSGSGSGSGINWQDYVQRYHAIEFAVRWRYVDGTYGPWTTRLRGNITSVDEKADPGAKWALSVRASDPIIRMTGKANVIDEKFIPLDFFLRQYTPFYGAEAIYHILRMALGDAEANRLNGNTTGTEPSRAIKLKYFAPGHYSLIPRGSDRAGYLTVQWMFGGSAPAANGALFMPKWGKAPVEWLSEIATHDFALFYYGFPGGYNFNQAEQTVAPIYGHYYTLMKSRPLWRVTDANYIAGDLNNLLSSAAWSDLPEWQINEVQVWANPGQNVDASSLPFPAVVRKGAALPPSHPGAAVHSWRRVLVEQNPVIVLPPTAQALASMLMLWFRHQHIRRVRVEITGEERMSWGDKLVMQLTGTGNTGDYSPEFLNLSGETFRIISVNNRYQDVAAGVEGFKTTVGLAPFSEDMER